MPQFDLNQHECEACVITCMDFRIFKDNALADYFKETGVKSYDLICVPGAGKAVIEESSRDLVLNAIKISLELHKSKIVYLCHHSDCGAYGGKAAVGTDEDELIHHDSEMNKAKEIIQKEIGSFIPIKKFLFTSDESNNLMVKNLI